jgi:hypothetical protein
MKMKDVMFWLNQIGCDHYDGVEARALNRAKTELQQLIVDGERHEMAKLYPRSRFIEDGSFGTDG